MCSEASTVLRAVAADFSFNCWCVEIPSDNRTYEGGPLCGKVKYKVKLFP
jgi:hypothetical protein